MPANHSTNFEEDETSLDFQQPYLQLHYVWVATVVTFFSFCRSGELMVVNEFDYDPSTHLSLSDVAADHPSTPSIISLLIKRSKTDPAGQGVKVFIGRTGDDLCPVQALLDYLKVRGDAPGALFWWQDGSPLSKMRFVSAIWQALSAANLPAEDFGGHSLRIGATTTAAYLYDSAIQWEDGVVHPTSCTSEEILTIWQQCHLDCQNFCETHVT